MLCSVKKLALVLGLLTLAPAGALATNGSSLTAVSMHPLVLQGSKFHPGERVRVTVVVSEETLQRTAVVTRRGRFRTDFGEVTFERCGAITARAAGSGGSRAFLKRLPLPACMPARAP